MAGEIPARFYNWLLLHNLRTSTARCHLNMLRLLNRNVPKLTKNDLIDFLLKLKEEGKRHSYLNHYIVTAKTFTRFLNDNSIPCDLSIEQIRQFKPQPFQKATMSDN